jgi:Carboxypeptidase regulatory-like domain/Protein of unknown function (DUF1416)
MHPIHKTIFFLVFTIVLALDLPLAVESGALPKASLASPTVTGRLVNEAGEPVVGAEVTLSFPVDSDSDEDVQEEEIQGAAVSGPEGRFELRPVTSGFFSLIARHPDYAELYVPGVEIPAGRTVIDLGPVVLPVGGILEGKVTDIDGKPIEGAEVRISPHIRTPGLDGNPESRVKTGPDGVFRSRSLRRGDRFQVTVSHRGYLPARLPTVPVPPEVPVRMELKPLRGFPGRVGSEGEPVEGSMADWQQEDYLLAELLDEVRDPEIPVPAAKRPVRDSEPKLGPEEKKATLSGRVLGVAPVNLPRTHITAYDSHGGQLLGLVSLGGTYRIRGAAPGDWNLVVMSPGVHAFGDVRIFPGQMEATLDLEVEADLVLSGRILLDGKPFAGALVQVLKGGDESPSSFGTEYDGSFRIFLEKPGPLIVKVLDSTEIVGTVQTLQFERSQEIVLEVSSKPD